MIYSKTTGGVTYANDSGEKDNKLDIKMSNQEIKDFDKFQLEEETNSRENETKIIAALGAKDKLDAIVKQINLINEAIATGDNAKIKEVDTAIKTILNANN